MNWWVDKPYSPVAIPKSILTTLEMERCSRPETFRPSLKGTARSARSYHGCRNYARRQLLRISTIGSPDIAQTLGKFGHQRAVLLKYSRELSCEMKREFRDCGPSIEGDHRLASMEHFETRESIVTRRSAWKQTLLNNSQMLWCVLVQLIFSSLASAASSSRVLPGLCLRALRFRM